MIVAGTVVCPGQNHSMDSLRQVLKETRDAEKRSDLLHGLVVDLWDYDLEEGGRFAEESYQLAEAVHYTEGVARGLTDLGIYHYYKGNYPRAESYFQRAVGVCKGRSVGDFPASTFIRLGNLARVQGDFDSARFYYNRVRAYAGGRPDRRILSSYHHNRGLLLLAESKIDSALLYFRKSLALRSALGDSVLIGECWNSMGLAFRNSGDYDSAAYYYGLSFGVGKRFDSPRLLVMHYINRGELYFLTGQFKPASDYFSLALDILKTNPFKRYHATVLNHVGLVFSAEGNHAQALEYFLNALRLDEDMNNRQAAAQTLGRIGWVYVYQGNLAMGLDYAERSLKEMERLKDRAGIAFVHHLLGHLYYVQRDYERSLRHFEIALSLRKEIKASQLVSATIFSMARVFEAQGSIDKALSLLMQVEERISLRQDRPAQVMLYNTLGALYIRQGALATAAEHLQHAQTLLRQVSMAVQQRDNYKLLAELCIARGDYRQATRYYDRFIVLNDSVFTNRSSAKIAEVNSLYQLEKKEQALQTLHEQFELKNTESKLQDARIRLQNSFLFSLVVGIVLLVGLLFVLFQYYHTKSRANKKLVRLNEEIVEQKEEIQAQSEELVEANQSLVRLNHELLEKREEMEAQSEELREANEMILAINDDLDSIVTRRTHQLKEAYQELDTFFYRSSHDFRRPLTTFLGLAEVAKITVKDTNALELFDKVRETALNLDKMLVKLQSISDVGAQELVYKPVLVGEIFESVCADFQDDLLHRGIRVQRSIVLSDPFISYPAMVRIIVENLVENSIQFCAPENAQLELRAHQENGWVVMSVRDNGYGIPQEYQGKIFDMYFRGTERSKGNGLGLYIVKKAVGKLHGEIHVVSSVGLGTMLEVRLPRHGIS